MARPRRRPATLPIGGPLVVDHRARLARYRALVADWSWSPLFTDAVEDGLTVLPGKPRTIEPGNYAWPSADLLRVLRDAFRAAGSDLDDLPAIAEAVAERFPGEDNAAEIADFLRVTAGERLAAR